MIMTTMSGQSVGTVIVHGTMGVFVAKKQYMLYIYVFDTMQIESSSVFPALVLTCSLKCLLFTQVVVVTLIQPGL